MVMGLEDPPPAIDKPPNTKSMNAADHEKPKRYKKLGFSSPEPTFLQPPWVSGHKVLVVEKDGSVSYKSPT